MNKIIVRTLCLISLLACFSSTSAANLFSLKIGTTWPQALLSSGIPSGDAGLNYGILVDRRVGFGFSGDFLWNVRTKDTLNSTTGTYFRKSENKSFMFPLMGFFLIDPIPDLIVHPVARFEIGYNSMIYIVKRDTAANTGTQSKTDNPYYNGLIIKAALEGLYNLGANSALYLGTTYQWAEMSTTDDVYKTGVGKLDMSGIGLYAGFRVSY